MPRVQITLNDGTTKTVELEEGFTDSDIDEIAGQLNSQIKPTQQPTQQPVQQPIQDKQAKLDEIKARYEAINKEIDAENRKAMAKLYGGAALEIGSAAIPIGAGARLAGSAIKAIAPYVGRKIAKEVGTGLISGGLSGAVFGGGRGLMENENPLKTAVQDALLGSVSGGAVGGVMGKVGKTIAANKLKDLPTASRADKRVVKDVGKKYYQDYIQDTSVTRDDLGRIDFDSMGVRENWRQKPKNMVNYPDLKKNIKNAKYIGEEVKEHEIEGVKSIHRLRNGNEDYLIAETNNGKKFYISRPADLQKIAPEVFAAEAPNSSSAINSITDAVENINPDVKQSGLTQSVANAKGTPKEVKQILKNDFPEYQVMHNNELTNQAVQEVESNFNNELSRLTSAKDFEALDYEKSRQLAKRLFDAGRHEEAVNLIDNVSENATKKGQAIQALSLWSNMTPEGAVYKAEKLIKEYNKKVPARKQITLKPEQIEQIRSLQDAALNATDDLGRTQGLARTAKYVSELVPKNIGQKLKAYRNISLLLNPKTLGRNIIGNTLFNAVDTVSKTAAVPIDRAIGLVTGNKTRVAPQLGELLKGGLKGAKTGFQEALEGIDTRGLGKRFDLQEGRTFQNPVMQKLETALDVGLRMPDRTQYEATFAESVANMMKAQGLKEPTQEILEQAEKEALESVFQNDSAIADLTTKVRRAMNTLGTKDFGLGDLAIPYAQTPANLVQQAINYSPLGLAKGIGNLAQGNQRQASLDLARALMGTGLIGGSYALSQNGNITPSQFDENYQKNKLIKANLATMGIKPETINGMWYAPFQPMSTSVAIGNAMANGEAPLQAGLNTMLDLPFLQNVNRGLADIKDKGIAEAGVNFAGSLPAQFVPTLASQIGQTIDPYQRETYDANKLKQGLNQAIAKVPMASQTLPEKIDVQGKPIERYTSEGVQRMFDIFVNPTYINEPTNDTVMNELKALYDETGDTKQFLPIVDKKLKFKDDNGEEQRIELTGEQLSNYQKVLGSRLYKEYAELMQTNRYQNADDETRVKLLEKGKQVAKNDVDAELFGKPNVQSRKKVKDPTAKLKRLQNKIDKQLIDSIFNE